jgi:2'-5' RNA ligase
MQTTRTFVAIPLGAEQTEAACQLIEELRAQTNGFRWVAPQNLHLTLVFLGEIANEQISAVCAAVNRATAEAAEYELTLMGVSAFPNLDRPRTVWIGCREGAAETTALHDTIETQLVPLGCRREQRAFVPHLTIARATKHGPAARGLRATFARLADWHGGTTRVREVQVLGSELSREGPTYTILGRCRLGTSG